MNCFDSFCSINKTGMYTREICNENTVNFLPKCTHTLFICQEVFTFYLFTSFMLKDTNDRYRNSYSQLIYYKCYSEEPNYEKSLPD